MPKKQSAKPRRHSKRVAAWIYTVINPIIDSLQREAQFLEKGNLTWRCHLRRLEYIRPVQEYVDTLHWPNYEDFLADNAKFRLLFSEHDQAVLKVEDDASKFYDVLLQAPIFQRQVAKALETYESKVDPPQPGFSNLAYMRDDLPKYVAENLINRVEAMPQHYTIHKFWEMFAHEFQVFKDRQTFVSLSVAVQALLKASTQIRRALEDHRLLLARKFDIPAAPIGNLASHDADAFIS